MQIKNQIKIWKAKRRDARAEIIIPRGYYEELTRIMIETENATDSSKLQVVIDKTASIYARSIDYKKRVLKVIERVYYKENHESAALDLQSLTFMRKYQSGLQKEIESTEAIQSLSKLFSKWRNGKISREQLLSSSRNAFRGLRYAN